MAEEQPAWEALTAHVRLTVHELVLDVQPSAGGGEVPDGLAPPPPVRIPRTGEGVRADDSGARLGYSWLDAAAGRVLLTRLRRSRSLIGLPAPLGGGCRRRSR